MAKRFTCTDKWKKKFIRGLDASYKLLWLYVLDDCNHAGIWEVDFEVAELRLGVPINEEKALNIFAGKVYPFDNNSKWFVPDFIEFQYGNLSETNRAHTAVIAILEKYDLINILENKPHISPLQGAMDMDKDKEKDKDKDKEQKIEFAKNVKMTETEFKKLSETHGGIITKLAIEKLDSYKGSTGKKYKDDYRAILSWVIKQVQKEIKENGATKTRAEQFRETGAEVDEYIDSLVSGANS